MCISFCLGHRLSREDIWSISCFDGPNIEDDSIICKRIHPRKIRFGIRICEYCCWRDDPVSKTNIFLKWDYNKIFRDNLCTVGHRSMVLWMDKACIFYLLDQIAHHQRNFCTYDRWNQNIWAKNTICSQIRWWSNGEDTSTGYFWLSALGGICNCFYLTKYGFPLGSSGTYLKFGCRRSFIQGNICNAFHWIMVSYLGKRTAPFICQIVDSILASNPHTC